MWFPPCVARAELLLTLPARGYLIDPAVKPET
jgi:hypothetical protein